MRKYLAVGLILAISVVFATVATAVQITIDLDKLSPEEASAVIAAQKKAALSLDVPAAEKMEAWADVGAKIGKAIAATCKELSVEVNEFIKTPVGKLTVVLIVWKIMGKDVLQIIGGAGTWFVLTLLLIWSFRHFHMREKIVNQETKAVTYLPRYEFKTGDARCVSSWGHAIMFVVITLTCMLIVF